MRVKKHVQGVIFLRPQNLENPSQNRSYEVCRVLLNQINEIGGSSSMYEGSVFSDQNYSKNLSQNRYYLPQFHDIQSTLKHSLPRKIVELSFKFIKQNLRDSLTKKTKVEKDRSTMFPEGTVIIIPIFQDKKLNLYYACMKNEGVNIIYL